jgi:hypothetical protein
MARKGFSGIGRVRRMLKRLPDEFRAEMEAALKSTGQTIRAGMQAKLAATTRKRTGALSSAINFKVYPKSLALRVGIIGRAARSRSTIRKYRRQGKSVAEVRNLNGLFYGRVLNFGRRAQVVLVQRRRRVEAAIGLGHNRGILRTERGRKVAEDIVSTYRMNVPAIAPKRFVTGLAPDLRSTVAANTRGIMARALKANPGLADD